MKEIGMEAKFIFNFQNLGNENYSFLENYLNFYLRFIHICWENK